MRQSHLDFATISRALSGSIETLKENGCDVPALEKLADAQKALQQAISFSCSRTIC